MAIQTEGIVIKNQRVNFHYFLMEIDCPSIARQVRPGQFIMLKTSGDHSPLLRRPFSVYKRYRGHLFIFYKIVGKGTRKMTELKPGEAVDMIGPLGNGFSLPPLPSSGEIILIGGGVGIVSLLPLAESLKTKKLSVFIGARTKDDILCADDLRRMGCDLFVATEDGSLGFKGMAIDLFRSRQKGFPKDQFHYIYGCGPMEMLRALSKVIKLKSVCQVSLETRMACGIGACWGCVVRTKHPESPYQRVCKEGPVFNLKDIVWES